MFIQQDFHTAVVTLFLTFNFTNTLRRIRFAMLRRVLFVSTLMLASTIGFANSAKAQTAVSQPVMFRGTVPATCTLGYTAATDEGALAVSGDGKTLSSSLNGGTAADININCAGRKITVTAPTKTGGTGTTATTDFEIRTAKVTMGSTVVQNTDTTGSTAVNGAATVDMTVTDNTAVIAPGTYEFTVTVSAIP